MPFLAHFSFKAVSHSLLNVYLCIIANPCNVGVGDYALKYFGRYFNAF